MNLVFARQSATWDRFEMFWLAVSASCSLTFPLSSLIELNSTICVWIHKMRYTFLCLPCLALPCQFTAYRVRFHSLWMFVLLTALHTVDTIETLWAYFAILRALTVLKTKADIITCGKYAAIIYVYNTISNECVYYFELREKYRTLFRLPKTSCNIYIYIRCARIGIDKAHG